MSTFALRLGILALSLIGWVCAPTARAEVCRGNDYNTCDISKVKPANLDIGKALRSHQAKRLNAAQISFHLNRIGNLMVLDRNAVMRVLKQAGMRVEALQTKRLSFKKGYLRSGWDKLGNGGSVHFDRRFHSQGVFRINEDTITFMPDRLAPKQKIVSDPALGKIVTFERVSVPIGRDDTYHVRFAGGTLGQVEGLGNIDGPISFVGGFPYIPKGGRLTLNDIVIADTKAPVLLCKDECAPVAIKTRNYVWFNKRGIQAQGRFSMQFTDIGYFDVLGKKEGYSYRRENDFIKIVVGSAEVAGKLDLKTGHNVIPEVNSSGFVRVISGNNRFTIVDGVLRNHQQSGDGRRGSVPVTILAASKGRKFATVVGESRKPNKLSMNDYAVMKRLRKAISFKVRGYFDKSVLEVFARSSRYWRDNHKFDLSLIRMRDQYGTIFPVTIIEGTRTSDGRGAEAPTGWPTDIYWFMKWMKPASGNDSYDTSVGYIFSGQSATHEIFHTISQLDSRRVYRMDSGPLYQAFSRALSGRRSTPFKAPSSYGSDSEEWLAGTGAALIHDPDWVRRNPGRQALVRPLLDHLQKYKSGQLPMPIIDRYSGYFFAPNDFQKHQGGERQFSNVEVTETQEYSEAYDRQPAGEGFGGFEN